MNTDDFIRLLATQAGPAPRAVVARRLGPALLVGAGLAVALVLGTFGPYPGALLGQGGMLLKLAYAAALALAAGSLTARLARPVARLAAPRRALVAVLAGMAGLALLHWFSLPAGARVDALLGRTWAVCPWIVLGASLPTLATVLWALRGLAPTRPRAAGLAAGLLAGAVGALAYALHCPELSPTFVAVWYSLGIALAGALGAWLGPRVLRW
ncbi:NrsF family protein [Sphaerotilus microaerophilus]|jgi:hypothetical protein|uniref:DUF1109 domain-containing protein n=1 Tax=Sphaerotilus microaerophilus TaxID=2914710 RepID=A0ABN6PG17_9BURK|nr:DUF1109 domain-containing protein [Sphaerotilus sp. FB-5]BDI03944.1 hypothetical protein CATMQ487_09140 [Sphaerotilus sp. FB-5]